MTLAVRYNGYGDIDVLQVVDVPRPVPGPGQVLVEVKAAGINPGEAAIRQGVFAELWPATFPSGQGSDLAGVVAEVGPGVTGVAVGDEVAAAAKYGAKTDGNAVGGTAAVIAELAALIDKGALEVPIAKVYPLQDVREAYRELEKRHSRGKIVLRP